MQCPSCEAKIGEDAKFCAECGVRLVFACAVCGHTNPARLKTCSQCRASLGHSQSQAPTIAEVTASLSSASPGVEHRHLTVMFCDLVAWTALSERLDPEDLRDVLQAYHRLSAQIVEDAGGMIGQYQGDGVLAYFGYPSARGDDAERAIRAALQLVNAIPDMTVASGPLRVRIGVATGTVIAGDIVHSVGADEHQVIGETPNLAARLQALAGPNMIVIASSTRNLTGRMFEYRDLGRHELKGITKPVEVWQVVGESGVDSRFKALRSGDSPLVDRSTELDILLRLWALASSGRGQVVIVTGEAGIGKSRLCEALRQRIVGMALERRLDVPIEMAFHGSPHHPNTAFYPIARQLERMADIGPADAAEVKHRKLALLLEDSRARGEADTLPLLADLLAIRPYPNSASFASIPKVKRQRTIDALRRSIEAIAVRQPVFLLFEDLQWADASTRIVFERLLEWAATARALIIATVRTGGKSEQPLLDLIESSSASWLKRSNVTVLELTGLPEEEAKQLITLTAKGMALSPAAVAGVLARTDGIPLYIEELTRGLIDPDVMQDRALPKGPLAMLAFPNSLRGLLASRLDRLGPAKEVAQQGAVIGREFSFSLLSKISKLPEDQLLSCLDRLVDADVVKRGGLMHDQNYLFRHALIRDAAYQSMLRRKRKELHLKIAKAVEEQGRPRAAELEFLAYHFAHAGEDHAAIEYLRKAAEYAISHSALNEASSHLRLALELLSRQPSNAERSRRELAFTMQLGSALRATRGYGAPDIEELYLRARHLCLEMGDHDKRFATEWGLMQVYLVKGKLTDASGVAAWLLDFANQQGTRKMRMDAQLASGMVNLHLGRLETAHTFLKQSTLLYRPERDGPRVLTHAQDPGIFAQGCYHWCLWFLGLPDSSRRGIEKTIQLARRKLHVFSLVSALTFGIRINYCLRDLDGVERLVHELFAAARDGGYEYYEAVASVHLGWVLAVRDKDRHGLKIMNDALAVLGKSGTVLGLRGLLVELAEGYAAFGQKSEALSALNRARIDGGTHLWDAEVERMHGDILATGTSKEGSEAETAYRMALRIATEQGALSLELRAATSLGRLLVKLKRGNEALSFIQPVLAKFTEDSATEDLRAAQALIDSC